MMSEGIGYIENDTIYALATGAVVSAISIYRVSGPQSLEIGKKLSKRQQFTPRQLIRSLISDPVTGDVIDDVLLVFFPEKQSFTGEALLEIHSHGSVAVRRLIEQTLEHCGARLAVPGEFARRRFNTGAMTLDEAEGLASLIQAESEAQRRQAFRVLSGEIGQRAQLWKSKHLEVLALLEASIDFPEEDIGADTENLAAQKLGDLITSISDEDYQVVQDEKILSHPKISLLGPPNAGKSSLMNSLARREVSIVTATPGTTRDLVSATLVVEGVSLQIVDTAGLRDTNDSIESIGVKRALESADTSDIRIFVLSHDTWPLEGIWEDLIYRAELVVWNKSDLYPSPPEQLLSEITGKFIQTSAYSANSGRQLLLTIHELLGHTSSAESPISGLPRRRRFLRAALVFLRQAQSELKHSRNEAAIEALRSASESIALLIGEIENEEILDEVFSRFCIGK